MSMLIQSHYYQSSRMAHSASNWSGKLLNGLNNSKEYFSLKEINGFLAEENATLKNLQASQNTIHQTPNNNYQFISARVIKNSYNKRNNFITLSKGSVHGDANRWRHILLDKSHVASMLHDCEVALPALDQSQPASTVEYVLVAVRLIRIMRLMRLNSL